MSCLTCSSSADGFLLGMWKKSHPSIAKLIKYSSVVYRMICFSTWIMHHFETGFNDTCIGLSWASFMIFVIFWFSSGPAFRQDSVFWRFAGRRQLPSTYVIFKSQHTSNPDSVSTYFFPCLIYVPPPHSVSMPRLTWMIEYDGWIRTKMGQGVFQKKNDPRTVIFSTASTRGTLSWTKTPHDTRHQAFSSAHPSTSLHT